MAGMYDNVLNLLGRWRVASDARDARQAIAARHPRGGAMSKSLPPQYRPSPRRSVPFDAFPAARRLADARSARTDLARAGSELSRIEREVHTLAAEAVGERRARIRAGVEDLLRRAMEGVGRGEVSAIEVAALEARAMRVLAAIEPGPALARSAR